MSHNDEDAVEGDDASPELADAAEASTVSDPDEVSDWSEGRAERYVVATPDRVVSATGVVPAPIDEVWALIADLERLPDVLGNISRVERIEGEGFEPGVRWREFIVMHGRPYGEEMWLVEAETPWRAVVRSSNGGIDFSTAFVLTEAEAGTELTIETSAYVDGATTGQRLTWRALGRSMMKDTRKALERDIADFVAWVGRVEESDLEQDED